MAGAEAAAGRDDRVRVRVPYLRGYGGGVRRVLGDGLPRLAAEPGLDVAYAELCRDDADMDDMAGRGVRVDREVGVRGSGVLSPATGLRRRLDLARAAPRLAATVRRLRPWLAGGDVAYVHGYRDLLLVDLALRGVRPRPAVVWHCHGLGDRPPRLLAYLANRCAAVVAVSASVRRRLERAGIRPDRIRLVPNAVNADEVRRLAADPLSPLPSGGDTTLLLPSAAIRANKGPHVAVAALAALPDAVHLWITGDVDDPVATGCLGSLRALAGRLGVTPRVRFIGQRDDVYAVMARCDVVVAPSLVEESFGLVAAEALVVGTPVVVSDRGALPEVVEDGVSGLVVPADEPGVLAEAVGRLLADPELAGRLVAAGRRRAEDAFGYGRWQREVAGVLREAATQRGAGRRVGQTAGVPR